MRKRSIFPRTLVARFLYLPYEIHLQMRIQHNDYYSNILYACVSRRKGNCVV